MSRSLLPRDRLGARGPMLAVALLCVVFAMVFFAVGRPVGAFSAMVAAFLIVAAAKRR